MHPLVGPTAMSLSSRRRKSSPRRIVAQAIELLEPRRLLASVPPGFNADTSYGGSIVNGTAMDFSPDGRLWVATQTGSLWVIPAGGGTATLALTLPVDSFFERGMLGIAFDPNFDVNTFVYIFWTDPDGANPSVNRISRFTVTGNTVNAGSQTNIFTFNPLGAGNHNGGGLHFGPDGMLYAAHGENAVTSNAQSVTNLLGKIVRINPATFVAGNPESVVPNDNPSSFIVRQGGVDVTVTPSGINRAIWALGLRNPYTFAFQPGTERMHINDVGASSWEEVNVGGAGLNYGWPTTEGPFTQASFPNFTHPLYWYANDASTSAIVGGAFYNTQAHTFPADYTGDYFFADLSAGWIRRLDAANGYALQTTGGASGSSWIAGGSGLVDLKIGPDGGLYFLQRGGGNGGQGVRVIRPTDPLPYVSGSEFQFDGATLPDAPHQLRFTFSEDVSASLAADDLVLENLTTSTTVPTASIAVSYNAGTNTATFTFPGFTDGILPDGDYRATLVGAGVTDATAQAMAQNQVVEFFFLQGDANHDRRVNLADFNILAANFGQEPRTFSQGDFNYDGRVNLADFNILAGRFGMQLDNARPGAVAADQKAEATRAPLPAPAQQGRPSPFNGGSTTIGAARGLKNPLDDTDRELLV